jgi:predicted TPR repeat methyltransferase
MNAPQHQTTSEKVSAAWRAGHSLRESGRPAEALRVLRKALRTEPDDFRLHDEIGMALVVLNRQEEAIGSFMTALQLKPDCDEVCNKIGSAFAARGLMEPAAEWFHRARQLNPASTKYLCTYGRVLVELDSRKEAAEILAQWVESEPENPIPRHLSAAVLGTQSMAQASPEYVRALFNPYADHFEESLARLSYCGPALALDALDKVVPLATGLRILDAGCGTGLVGAALKPRATSLTGVDLSAGMLAIARERGLYDELVEADIVDFLSGREREFDIIVAADVVTYIGDLSRLFSGAAKSLRPGGCFVIIAEALKTTGDYRLNTSGRFSHSREYLEHISKKAGLAVAYLEEDVMRHEGNTPVATWVVVIRGIDA